MACFVQPCLVAYWELFVLKGFYSVPGAVCVESLLKRTRRSLSVLEAFGSGLGAIAEYSHKKKILKYLPCAETPNRFRSACAEAERCPGIPQRYLMLSRGPKDNDRNYPRDPSGRVESPCVYTTRALPLRSGHFRLRTGNGLFKSE